MHAKPIHIEKEMLLRLQQGDEQAFLWIYHAYKSPIGYKLLRLLKSETLVEEMMQDIFLKVWEHRASIDVEKSFKAYLYRISQNMVIDLFRRAKKEKAILEEIIAGNTELYTHIEESIFQKENASLLNRLIEQLPAQRKKIFIACKLEGKSYKEVADQYGITASTVNDHLQKAMHYLKSKLFITPDALLIVIINLIVREF